MSARVTLDGASKSYGQKVKTLALRDTTLTYGAGELAVILGPSGSGKTTLLNLIGGLDRPDQGKVIVDGQEVSALSPAALTSYRREKVGFVFQFFNLVPTLTARENVQLAAELVGAERSVDEHLAAVGLSGLEERFPAELSGGQQQRVAVARALAKRPKVILADEPTGALDEESGKQVLALLVDAARERASTVLVVTHNGALAAMADRVTRLKDGAVVSDEKNDAPRDPRELHW